MSQGSQQNLRHKKSANNLVIDADGPGQRASRAPPRPAADGERYGALASVGGRADRNDGNGPWGAGVRYTGTRPDCRLTVTRVGTALRAAVPSLSADNVHLISRHRMPLGSQLAMIQPGQAKEEMKQHAKPVIVTSAGSALPGPRMRRPVPVRKACRIQKPVAEII